MPNKTKNDFQQKFSKLEIKSDSLNELSQKDLEDLKTLSMCVEGSMDELFQVLDGLGEFYKCCFFITLDRFGATDDNQIDENTNYAFEYVNFIKKSIRVFNELARLNDTKTVIAEIAVNVSSFAELLELIEDIETCERLHDICYTISYLTLLPSDKIFLPNEHNTSEYAVRDLIAIFSHISNLHFQLKFIVSKLKDIKYKSHVIR